MTLGAKIKKLRTDKGLTQKDLADQVHVTFQTVSKWEKNENEPDISTIKELSKIFNCSVQYLIDDDLEEDNTNTPVIVPASKKEEEKEPVTKTIIIHQKELHVCERCKKDIPEGELELARVCTRPAGRGHSAEYRAAYYHKSCYAQIMKEKAEAERRLREEKASRTKKLSFGWGIAGGVVAFTATLLVLLLVPDCQEIFHPAAAVGIAVGAGYAIFAMLYCIITGSYIGDVFVWCATLSVKFPGLIFSWSIEGFAWLIAMKILFAILGFLIGVAALFFAIGLSALLGAVSFPFVLIHNINTNYQDGF